MFLLLANSNVPLFVFVAMLVPNWNINISNIARRSIEVEWSHYSPNHPYQLVLYTVVCTPTHGKAGPTILNVDKANDRSHVERLTPGTNYTVEVVALIFNDQSGAYMYRLKRSQKENVETDEGGEANDFSRM